MLRRYFSTSEIIEAIERSGNKYSEAARILTSLGRGLVSKQNVQYWAKQLSIRKKNGEPYIGTTVVDRSIREGMKLRVPTIVDDAAQIQNKAPDTSCVLIFGDMHAPYHHPDCIAFLGAIKRDYGVTMAICTGDETDGHALSFHDSDPNLDSAGPELNKARTFIASLEKLFPALTLAHSNHGSLVYRRAKKHGIPAEMIKSYRDILFPEGGGAGWSWHNQIRITLPNGDDLQVEHEQSGDILGSAAHERCNFVQGHRHGKAFIEYAASKAALYWAGIPGCLLNNESLAFEYAATVQKKPVISVMIVKDSIPCIIPMALNKEGRWIGEIPKLYTKSGGKNVGRE